MVNAIRILPIPNALVAGGWRRGCRISGGSEASYELWWEYPLEVPEIAPEDCDSFLLAALMPAMKQGLNIKVQGSVSQELLANLTEFQKVWIKWCPEIYREVAIEVDRVRPREVPAESAVVAFSGGADAQFSAYRHATGLAGHASRPLIAGVFVHGFDIPLGDPKGFDGAANLARRALGDLGLRLIHVQTNVRDALDVNWEHLCGTAIASVLHGMKGYAGVALIASGEPYDALVVPWGSHPMTNPLLSSGGLRVVHDGAGYSRSEKIRGLSGWEVGIQNLRVCWAGGAHDRNCGKCEKCVRTRLNFLLSGVAHPACFTTPLEPKLLRSVVLRSDAARAEWRLIREEISRTGIGRELLPEVDKVLRRPATKWGRVLPAGSRRRALVKRILGKV